MNTNTVIEQSNFIQYIEDASKSQAPCLTIVMSTPGGGKDFRLHLSRAETLLNGVLKNQRWKDSFGSLLDDVVARGRELISDSVSWSGDYESICIHVSPQFENMIKLDTRSDDRVMVGDRFLFKEVQQQFDSNYDGLVLRICLKEPKLYRVKNNAIREIEGIDLPESIYSLSDSEVVDGGSHAHVRKSSSGGSPEMTGHGMGGKESVKDLNIDAFAREVVNALDQLDGAKTLPMILMGEDKLVSLFSKKFERIFSGALYRAGGSSGHASESDIFEESRRVGKQCYQKQVNEVLKAFKDVSPDSSKFSDNLKEIYEGSEQGRIAVCAISQESRIWAEYDAMTAKLSTSHSNGFGDGEQFELLDTILTNVVKSDGRCVSLPKSEMPSSKDVVAIYKW